MASKNHVVILCLVTLLILAGMSDANEENSREVLKKRVILQRLFERYKLGKSADPDDACYGSCDSQSDCEDKDGCDGWYCDMSSNQCEP